MSYQKFALILGCNYFGENQLYGCINDAMNIRKFLVEKRGFDPAAINCIFDSKMTKAGMWKGFNDLVDKTHVVAKTGKIPAVFLYYSGHGIRGQPSMSKVVKGDNDQDGDEYLVPYDFEKNGFIVDDDLNTKFLRKLHPSTELFIFTDCCNSGTNFDLGQVVKGMNARDVTAKVIHLASCRDNQVAFEENGGGIATGRFLRTVDKIKTVQDIPKLIGTIRISGRVQNPMISTSTPDLHYFTWMSQLTRDVYSQGQISRDLVLHRVANFFSNFLK